MSTRRSSDLLSVLVQYNPLLNYMICQHLYWPGIINAVRKEVTNCDTLQRTKLSNKKHGKLPAKEAEEIPKNILCGFLIDPYDIRRKGKKENLDLKSVTMIYPVTGL